MLVEMLRIEEAKLDQKLNAVRTAINALEESEDRPQRRGWPAGRKMSPETKAKISRAMKAKFALKIYKRKHPRSG